MKIEIVPYNPAWPAEFHEIGNQIRGAVGHAALTIHHIGSTSVPGLSAKDLIDVLWLLKTPKAPECLEF